MKFQISSSKVAEFIMWMAALLLLLTACVNPYKYLPDRPPKTEKDTAALLARCVEVLPADTSTEVKPIVVPQRPDSSEYFKGLADSIAATKQTTVEKLKIDYRDTCRSAVDQFEKGFDIGYKMGEYQGKSKAESKCADEILNNKLFYDSAYSSDIGKLKQGYSLKILKLESDLTAAQGERDRYKHKMQNRGRLNLWLIIACLVLLIISILLWKFRRQAKAANKSVNSVRDIYDTFKK